ncbi:OmpA family protein [Spiribacter halobius]|uniref:OmpA-like domain-containing protein n=1 Tax=Sediminicurvatus halobius TaxID=2182432 RepID=A0A2U2N470_9GAMM|nr:OmpA family protein [Spiribacter halobius]PWG63873.1 hypothetical protein DEM34_06625 [Spiribacter halobius]UEX76278.1 OmpA family protein [Spiribacter halobius]
MRLAATLSALALLGASGIAAAQSEVNAPWTNPQGQPWTNEAGECWREPGTDSGPIEACGDAMPEPEPEPEPAADSDAMEDEPETVTRVQELELDSRALFEFGSARLTRDGRNAIREGLAEAGGDWRLQRVRVIGHTDRIGSAEDNQRLSRQRAESVASYLESRPETDGVEIEAVGRGENDPVVTCEDDLGREALIECLAPNRRVVMELELEREVQRQVSE